MRYLTFNKADKYPIVILVSQIREGEIRNNYITPYGLNPDEICVIETFHTPTKTPVKELDRFITEELQQALDDVGCEYVICADGEYFKRFTNKPKVEAFLGYVLDSVKGSQKFVTIPNYTAIFYNPEIVVSKITQGVTALLEHRKGDYDRPGNGIIKDAHYPLTDDAIQAALDKLLELDRDLTADIEGFSLKHFDSGIGTISFAVGQHRGIAFPIDYQPILGATEAPFGQFVINAKRRKMLKEFFIKFAASGRSMKWHSISFDVYVLIYQLFMDDILDTEGLLKGMEIMLANWDCTKLITYLATNSCAGNRLGLKIQAQEFAGNYAMDDEAIKDITRIPLDTLLEYNLVDALSTWYVFDKHWPTLVADDQEDIYLNIFKPAMHEIVQMQLTGMPVNMKRAIEVNGILEKELAEAVTTIQNNEVVKRFTSEYLDVEYARKKNEEWKVKRITPEDAHQVFNPNSDVQMKALLFDYLNLPVINLTKSKQPSSDGESIEALLSHAAVTDPAVKEMLGAFQLHSIISILTSNFMPSILGAKQGPDGWHYLFGNFNLGGTLSGRLSSNGPNLQNLPSTGKGHPKKLKYAKLIKSCFSAPPGWIFCGIDADSLEDRISALTTKDPNKLKVYTDGYDGHSLRAFAYFGDKMSDIDGNSVVSINSIAKKYKPLRDRSKNPTFTLTYQGTWIALVKKYGFTKEEAQALEAKYHELYIVSDDWVNARLDQAMKDGYITGAFGLRLRTPLLKQVIRGTSKTPFEAEAEGRTAGNALGQSWCMLNTRSGSEIMQQVRKSKFRLDIRPCAQIHDAGYFLIRDDIAVVDYCNQLLVKAYKWQDHPEIWHDKVKLGGGMFICHPDWTKEIELPREGTPTEIEATIREALAG